MWLKKMGKWTWGCPETWVLIWPEGSAEWAARGGGHQVERRAGVTGEVSKEKNTRDGQGERWRDGLREEEDVSEVRASLVGWNPGGDTSGETGVDSLRWSRHSGGLNDFHSAEISNCHNPRSTEHPYVSPLNKQRLISSKTQNYLFCSQLPSTR